MNSVKRIIPLQKNEHDKRYFFFTTGVRNLNLLFMSRFNPCLKWIWKHNSGIS